MNGTVFFFELVSVISSPGIPRAYSLRSPLLFVTLSIEGPPFLLLKHLCPLFLESLLRLLPYSLPHAAKRRFPSVLSIESFDGPLFFAKVKTLFEAVVPVEALFEIFFVQPPPPLPRKCAIEMVLFDRVCHYAFYSPPP